MKPEDKQALRPILITVMIVVLFDQENKEDNERNQMLGPHERI